MSAAPEMALASLDGRARAVVPVLRPERLRAWDALRGGGGATVPRGAGLSYAGLSFGGGAVSVSHARFDRLMDYDAGTGELTVEAGATLWAVQRFLVAQGRFLPCHPGHGRITVGGCVAVDAHGKNPARDGTFRRQVAGLELFHPDHGTRALEAGGEGADLLDLTCGAFGLTGHVLSVRLRSRPIPGAAATVTRRAFADTAEGLAALAAASAGEGFAYTWHDLSRAEGPAPGFVFEVGFEAGEGAPELGTPPGTPARGGAPVGLVRRASLPALNAAFRRRTARLAGGRRLPLGEALFPFHGGELYFRLFGRPGFRQHQLLVPAEAAAEVFEAARARAARRGAAIALASCKRFGGAASLLRFEGEGVAMALDVPRGTGADALAEDLDALVIEAGGRANLAKDSRLPRAVVEATCPGVDDFRARRAAADPGRRMRSALSERLGL